MMRFIALCALLLFPFGGMANEPPPVPEGGLTHQFTTPCSDGETGQKGTCYLMQDKDGTLYTVFYQGDTLMFIRREVPGGYETVWVNEKYNSI